MTYLNFGKKMRTICFSLIPLVLLGCMFLSKSKADSFSARDMGVELYNEGKYQLALDHFLESLDPDVPDFELYLYIAYCFKKMGELDHSIGVLEKAVSLIEQLPVPSVDTISPMEEKIYWELYSNHTEAGNKAKSIEVLREGLRRNSLSLKIFNELLLVETAISEREKLLEGCNKPILMRASSCPNNKK